MKKILLVIIVIVLSNCELKVQDSTAAPTGIQDVQYDTRMYNGMTYGIWTYKPDTSQSGKSVVVRNMTKDQLEVEKLRLEIAALKRSLK